MKEELIKIINMVQSGKITEEEAADLIAAIKDSEGGETLTKENLHERIEEQRRKEAELRAQCAELNRKAEEIRQAAQEIADKADNEELADKFEDQAEEIEDQAEEIEELADAIEEELDDIEEKFCGDNGAKKEKLKKAFARMKERMDKIDDRIDKRFAAWGMDGAADDMEAAFVKLGEKMSKDMEQMRKEIEGIDFHEIGERLRDIFSMSKVKPHRSRDKKDGEQEEPAASDEEPSDKE